MFLCPNGGMAVTPHLGCGAARHGGSSPSSGTIVNAGVTQLVESQPSKLLVASSSLVSRSIYAAFV